MPHCAHRFFLPCKINLCVCAACLCHPERAGGCSSGAVAFRFINAAFILFSRAKMEVVQKERWYFMALVLFPFLQGACADTAPPEIETVTIHLQEGMILDCLCPWDGNLTMVSWTKDPDTNSIAVFHPDYGVATTYHYRERIEFLRSTPMDGSITMKNVTHQDIGLYHCSVQTFPQGPWIRNIQVEDLDGPPVEDNEDNGEVMEAGAHMTAETSGNLSVECNQQRNGTIVHQAMVEHMAFGQPWVIIGICKRVEGGVLSEDYSERGQVTCQQNLDVSLQLTAVAQEDGGLYRCSFSTDTGLQTNTVMVTVLPSGRRADEKKAEISCTRPTHIFGGGGGRGSFADKSIKMWTTWNDRVIFPHPSSTLSLLKCTMAHSVTTKKDERDYCYMREHSSLLPLS
ncbi:CD226 antigen isoform X2 [Syngnathus scovelli]|uniref:CD226 antigen isoform X2 n=1 Tax=Syngnathus scovelli TaxID=161590 RepID=UPI00210F85C9|nr:CD226 antigen isoform X2 [Syngnathus scovelli]